MDVRRGRPGELSWAGEDELELPGGGFGGGQREVDALLRDEAPDVQHSGRRVGPAQSGPEGCPLFVLGRSKAPNVHAVGDEGDSAIRSKPLELMRDAGIEGDQRLRSAKAGAANRRNGE